MIKFKRIKFINHEILGNLYLDFTLSDGSIADTIIFAGENGTGKSNLLDAIYKLSSELSIDFEAEYDLVNDKNNKISILCKEQKNGRIFRKVKYVTRITEASLSNFPDFKLSSIYSDTNINFKSNKIQYVTSLNLDSNTNNKISQESLATEIKQLIVDIQAIDDSELAQKVRESKKLECNLNNVQVEGRMSRFTKAFDYMFDDLKYEGIENLNKQKNIMFKKFNKKFSIDHLSSGEKQIVYRGCFLLKDINSMKGAIVCIDEPEISMHPVWQKRIMGFYRHLFTDEKGCQTSQIFAVTHSPFVIHDDTLDKTKIIILKRNEIGEIEVSNEQKYYKCGNIEAIKEAFNISDFDSNKNYVFLEGRTDEKYFKKTAEVFGHNNLPFEFKWIGHIEDNGQEANTGSKPLNSAYNFLIDKFPNSKHICLYDCDTNIQKTNCKNISKEIMPSFKDNFIFKKGVENALILPPNIDIAKYNPSKFVSNGYGGTNTIQEFQKMDFCDYICSLPNEQLKEILKHLNEVILRLIDVFL